MSNIIAIAQKELRGYFASPIGYIVLGLFALVYGFFYYSILGYFANASLQGQPGQPMNINQDMIRYLMQNVTILVLFLMPMITMRTYSEEKRSGTIELLLTSPLTDFQIIMGKFFGALALWIAALAISLIHIALLYLYSTPEWKPIFTAYVGLILFGSCFICVGLFISSLTKNQIIAGVMTFGVTMLLWMINWIGPSSGSPRFERIADYLSLIGHFDDFAKGVFDTTHFIYYLSFIALGLFLTAKSVDSERWRG
jgi:ABC-2 type transport system permease protein